jgi:hypothetical protein
VKPLIRGQVVTKALWARLLPYATLGFCRLCGEQLLLSKTERTLTHGGAVCEMFLPTCFKAGAAVEVVFIPAPAVNASGGVA